MAECTIVVESWPDGSGGMRHQAKLVKYEDEFLSYPATFRGPSREDVVLRIKDYCDRLVSHPMITTEAGKGYETEVIQYEAREGP